MEDTELRNYTIYAIRCAANGKMYIGCTSDLQSRVHNHILELRRHEKIRTSNRDKHKTGVAWQEDFDTYGEEAFEFYALEVNVAHADRYKREMYWIGEYDTMNPANGYNVKPSYSVGHNIVVGFPPKPAEKKTGQKMSCAKEAKLNGQKV